jgi:hypothetical protein
MPTQKEIDEALAFADIPWSPSVAGDALRFDQTMDILAAAYRAEKARAEKFEADYELMCETADSWMASSAKAEARAELVERQYAELEPIVIQLIRGLNSAYDIRKLLARHEAERKALSSQAVDKASDTSN